HADADPIAGDARLRHFEQGIADPVMIADAHFSIRQSVDCKILSELAIGKVVSTELVLPITIRFDLVDKDCPVFAAMPRQISSAVSIDVEPSYHPVGLEPASSRQRCGRFSLATRCRVADPHLLRTTAPSV